MNTHTGRPAVVCVGCRPGACVCVCVMQVVGPYLVPLNRRAVWCGCGVVVTAAYAAALGGGRAAVCGARALSMEVRRPRLVYSSA